MKRYDGEYDEGIALDAPDRQVVFGRKSVVFDEDVSILIEAAGNDIKFGGLVSGDGYGLYGLADNTAIKVEHSCKIEAEVGLHLVGSGLSLINDGEVTGRTTAAILSGEAPRVINNGFIEGYAGIILQATQDGRVVNGREGEIQASFGVIVVAASADSENRVLNLGSVISSAYAFMSGDGREILVNRGLMDGGISLGEGNDRFDGRRGTTTGPVFGGNGDDTYLIDDAFTKILEDENYGEDTVISSINYDLPANFESLKLAGKKNLVGRGNDEENLVTGNTGDNRLYGGYGLDILAGGDGNDVLFGGLDEDVFIFGTGNGRDTIADFDDGTDHVDLTSWKGLSGLEDFMSHAQDKNGDLVIAFKYDQLTIENFSKEQLDLLDFTG